MKHSARWNYILLLAGLALFFWLIYKLGPSVILDYFRILGWKYLLVFSVSILIYIALTEGWREFLKGHKLKTGFGELFLIKVAGEAVNTVSPLSWGGGDPVRIYLLRKTIPVAESTASVVIDRTLNSMATLLFMMIGIFIAFVEFDFSFSIQVGFLLSFLFMIGTTFYWYRKQHAGLFQFLIRLLTRLKIKRQWSEETVLKLKEIDHLITRFYTHNKKGFFIAFWLQFLSRLLGVFEIYVAAYFLGISLSLTISYLLLSITTILNMIFVFVPGSVGILEGSYAGLFHLFGMDPAAGTSIQIMRRIRTVIWGIIGFGYLSYENRKKPIPHPAKN